MTGIPLGSNACASNISYSMWMTGGVKGGLNQFLPFMNRLAPRRTVRWLMGVIAKPPRTPRAGKVGL